MTVFTEKRLIRYEQLMLRVSDESFDILEDFLCQGCEHHRPDWEYRFCVFTECPKIKRGKNLLGGIET